MDISEYQILARKSRRTETETDRNLIIYPALSLTGEAGEVGNKIKKWMRRDIRLGEMRTAVKDELGDVLWYMAALADDLEIGMHQIARQNLAKVDLAYGSFERKG